jgi:hypothetical protein
MGLTSSDLLLAADTGDDVICTLCDSSASVARDSDVTCGATSASVTSLCTWTVPGEKIHVHEVDYD